MKSSPALASVPLPTEQPAPGRDGFIWPSPPYASYRDDEGPLLIVGWGSTYGAIRAAVEQARLDGLPVSAIHLRYLNPFPPDLGPILDRFEKVLVPEINRGQLRMLLRAEFLIDAAGLNRVRGLPLSVADIRNAIEQLLATKEVSS